MGDIQEVVGNIGMEFKIEDRMSNIDLEVIYVIVKFVEVNDFLFEEENEEKLSVISLVF